jgi:hypothetical protein
LILRRIEEASRRLSDESQAERERILQDVALQRIPAARARAALDQIAWATAALYHAWRAAVALMNSSGSGRSAIDDVDCVTEDRR